MKKQDKTEELKKQLEGCQKKCEEYLNGWKRERADFLNYKKEEMERIQGLVKYANEELILKMLPVLDNFEIAFKNLPENLMKDEHIKGILQIKNQILEFLKNQGVEEIKVIGDPSTSSGQVKFDPNFHEVVEEVSSNKYQVSGIIVEEVKKGYTLYGKVIRPVKVKVVK